MNEDDFTNIDNFFDSEGPFRRRARTYTDGVTKPAIKPKNQEESTLSPHLDHSLLSGLETLTSPRHYLRRKALVESELQGDVLSVNQSSYEESTNSLTLNINVEGYRTSNSVETMASHSLCDMIEFLIMKDDIYLKHQLQDYLITAKSSNEQVAVYLDHPSTSYTSCVVEIREKESTSERNHEKEALDKGKHKEMEFRTVKDCLDYFDIHGLHELPGLNHDREDSYHLPRVTPLDTIVDEWERLPIDPQILGSMTTKDIEQQRTMWELIHTEYTHLQTLETIINVFMRSMELIKRTGLLSEDNYHNIFGYMEDLYHAHEQLWTYTFEPCLNKIYENNLPLDLKEIINRFPKSFGDHFEVYEQHTSLESINTAALNKAMANPDFSTYLKWCEANPKCNRLGLKQLLATPFQRLTKYSLCIGAIIKKTASFSQKENLSKILDDINAFLHIVNNGIRIQQETERVKDAMNRITAYSVTDIPPELKDLVSTHTQLDLLAPMQDVELDKPRVLMVEGSIHYRDSIKQKTSTVYVFLFTDMLLVTKPSKKTSNKYTIIRPPFKVTLLNLHSLDSESICCLVMTEYNVLASWFILKANNPVVAKEWVKQIGAAQQYYQDAINKKAQTWKLMENLRSERILNGVENLESLSASLSQSLWSIHSLTNAGKKFSSNDCIFPKRASTPSLTEPMSGDSSISEVRLRKLRSSFSRSMAGSVDLCSSPLSLQNGSLVLERTSSLNKLSERPQSLCEAGMSTISESQLLSNTYCAPLHSSSSESTVNQESNEDNARSLHVEGTMSTDVHQKWPISDDSGTESNGTHVEDSFSKLPRGVPFEGESSDKQSSLPKHGKERYHETYSSRTLPLKSSMDKNISHKVPFTHTSRSLKDLNRPEKDLFVKPINLASSFPENGHPLKSILRRSPSPRVSVEYASPSLRHNARSASCDNSSTYGHTNVVDSISPRYLSTGCLDSPDMSLTPPSPKQGSFLMVSSPKMSPRFEHRFFSSSPSQSRHLRHHSEGSVPNTFNITYSQENGGQKARVSTTTLEEVEEDPVITDNDPVIDGSVSQGGGCHSYDEDEKSHKISKVMFSELAEVRSFNNEESDDSDMESETSTLQLIPGWAPKTAKENSVKSEIAEPSSEEKVVMVDANEESPTFETEAEPSLPKEGMTATIKNDDIVNSQPSTLKLKSLQSTTHQQDPAASSNSTKLISSTSSIRSSSSNNNTASTNNTKSASKPATIAKTAKFRYPSVQQPNSKGRLSAPRVPLKSKKEIIRKKSAPSVRSVRELSVMFESPKEASIASPPPPVSVPSSPSLSVPSSPSLSVLSPTISVSSSPPQAATVQCDKNISINSVEWKSARSLPKSPALVRSGTTNTTASSSKLLSPTASPHGMGTRKVVVNPKRSQSSIPRVNGNATERRKYQATTTSRKMIDAPQSTDRGKVARSPEPVVDLSSLLPSHSEPPQGQRTSHFSPACKNDTKISDIKTNREKISKAQQRGPRNPNPPPTKAKLNVRREPHPGRSKSRLPKADSSGATTILRAKNDVARNNSNGNNCNDDGSSTGSEEGTGIIRYNNTSVPQSPAATRIFRPRRAFTENDFDKCLPSDASFGFRSKLKNHRSFSSASHNGTLPLTLTKSLMVRSTHEWQNYGLRENIKIDPLLSSHQWKRIS